MTHKPFKVIPSAGPSPYHNGITMGKNAQNKENMTSQMVYLTLCWGKNWRGVWEESVPQTKANIMRKRIK